MKNKKGFTLVELLAVIVILGVLLLVAVPSVTRVISNSRINADKSEALQAADLLTTCGLNEGASYTTNCTGNGLANYLDKSSVSATVEWATSSTYSSQLIKKFEFTGTNGNKFTITGTACSISSVKTALNALSSTTTSGTCS
ncbi:MAG: type II secretion system protein [bacterium]|nr:type II secretion system protein [bacterium]